MPLELFDQTQFAGYVVQRSSVAAPGSLLELTNGAVDLDGVIRSRSGIQRINTTQLSDGAGSNNVHSHILYGDQRYVAIGTILKRGYEPAHPTIISGLNGNRLSFLHMSPSPAANNKAFTYFANGQAACRKKDDGTALSNWGMDGPTASAVAAITPTVGANQPATTLIDSFASAFAVQDGFGTEGVATTPYDTSARSFTVPATKNERFRHNAANGFSAVDLSPNGETAFIRFMLRVDNRQNLDHVEIAFSTDVGLFTTDFYIVRISALEFQEDNSWQEFKITKSAFERIKPGSTIATGSTDTWALVDGMQITVGANSKGQVVVSADDARMEADTHADGTYDYKITLWNDTLKMRSNGRRLADIYADAAYVTGAITVHRQRITIARPSDSGTWDAQATHWEAWRRNTDKTLGDGKWHYVSRVTVATTTMNDDLNELAVGEALLEDNHIPPPSKFIVGPFQNRCLFFGMSNATTGSGEEEAGYAFRWSEAGYPESVPLVNYGFAGDPKDPIRGGCIWAHRVILLTASRVYEVTGEQGGFVATATEAPIGTMSPYSIAPSPHGVFYRATNGIRLFTGGTSLDVSLEIAPLFQGETIVIDGLTIYPLKAETLVKNESVVGAFFEDRYEFVYTDVNNTRTTLYYNVTTKRWARAENSTAQSGWALQRLSWEKISGTTALVDNLEGGTSDGWLMVIDFQTNNSGLYVDGGSAAIPFAVQLKAWDAELKPTILETDLKDLVIDVDTGGQTLTVQASFDGAAYTSLGTVNTASRDKVFLPINGGVGTVAWRCAVRITGSLSTARVALYGVGTHHIPEPKRIIDFSTDYDRQGWPGEKLLQEIQIESQTFGNNVTMTVEADGTNLAQTFTLNTSIRKPQVFSFTIENPRATALRLKFDGTAEWKLYSYQFQFLQEPLTVTILETEVTTQEWPGEKILQELQITANTHGGDVTVVVEADGANLTQIFTLNTSVRRDRVFSFIVPHPRATNLRLKMTGAAPWVYYGHQFQFLKEPLSILQIETEVVSDGWPGPKLYREVNVEIDTHGAAVLASVLLDNAIAQTATLLTSAHTSQTVTMSATPEGRYSALRLVAATSTPFLYYGHVFSRTINLPNGVTAWDSAPQQLFGGKKGWLGPRAYFVVRGPAAMTADLYADQVLRATLTIPAQVARSALMIPLPIGVTGKILQVKITSSAAFQLFGEGSFIEAHPLDQDREMTKWAFTNQ